MARQNIYNILHLIIAILYSSLYLYTPLILLKRCLGDETLIGVRVAGQLLNRIVRFNFCVSHYRSLVRV